MQYYKRDTMLELTCATKCSILHLHPQLLSQDSQHFTLTLTVLHGAAFVLARTTMADASSSQTKPSRTPYGSKKHDPLGNAERLSAHPNGLPRPPHLGLRQPLLRKEAQRGMTNTPPLSIAIEHATSCEHEFPQSDTGSTTSLAGRNDPRESTTERANNLDKNPSRQGSLR